MSKDIVEAGLDRNSKYGFGTGANQLRAFHGCCGRDNIAGSFPADDVSRRYCCGTWKSMERVRCVSRNAIVMCAVHA